VRKKGWQLDIQELPKALHITITTTQLVSTSVTDMGKNYHLLFVIQEKFGCIKDLFAEFSTLKHMDYL